MAVSTTQEFAFHPSGGGRVLEATSTVSGDASGGDAVLLLNLPTVIQAGMWQLVGLELTGVTSTTGTLAWVNNFYGGTTKQLNFTLDAGGRLSPADQGDLHLLSALLLPRAGQRVGLRWTQANTNGVTYTFRALLRVVW